MGEVIRVGVAGALAMDANGNITGGKKSMPLTPNVKSLTPSQLTREQNEIVDRATRRENSTGKLGMTPAEIRRFEELEAEKASKEALHNEAKINEAWKLGQKHRQQDAQARRDATSEIVPVVSRSNQPGNTPTEKVLERHANRQLKPTTRASELPKIVSRSNDPDLVSRSEEIKARHAARKSR